MATSAQEEKHATVSTKRTPAVQAPMLAKARRIVDAVDLVYRSLGPLPPLTGMLSISGCQARQFVPWTRSRTNICKYGFWIAEQRNICSRLRPVQTSWHKSEIHCRTECQSRGTLHFHYLCYVPQGVLELPLSDGSYRAARKRLRDGESPSARLNHIAKLNATL